MRRAIALATLIALAAAGTASAEHWTKYVNGEKGTEWSYDADYLYKDQASGRLVVLQAISKPSASFGPGAPGKPDGVGSLVSIDCRRKSMTLISSYTPSKPLAIGDRWRSEPAKRADGPENEALVATVCPLADQAPVK